ncbi:MAG: TolC family protein [Lachnospiraceae bacterium]|nr:TolC family protein [Lachnospiraceae bacterium]
MNRITSFFAALLMLTGAFLSPVASLRADAAQTGGDKLLTLNAAKALAIEESTAYFQAEQAIEVKQANLESARKAIKLKQASLSQFRWSPLLNFKFPTQPTEAEAYEFQFKPVSIQAEIDVAENKLIDTQLSVFEEINNLYVEIVFLQRKISFEQQRLEAYKKALERNQTRLYSGDATQADVDALEKKLEKAKETVAGDQRNLTAKLEKLSTKLGTDVSTGYRFETPFLDSSIPRSVLDPLIQYTLDHDQTYYEACMNETTARISLKTNYNLMSSKYGGDIYRVSGYVNQALNGKEIKGSLQKAFKSDYKMFLEKIDSYWKGKKRILFVKIPKLWFKGSLDGTRYIDDDPNVLYEDVLNYSAAQVAKKDAQNTVVEQVKDSFENYISIRNSYLSAIKELDKAEKDLEADFLRNKVGEVSFEEYSSEADDYEELQNSFLDLMKTYSETLYSFDRLTCGAVSAYFAGNDADLGAADSAYSHVEKTTAEGAYYYIRQVIQNEAFILTVYIPEDFEVSVTHFELWCDGEQIGERTEIDKELEHLAITKNVLDSAKIRLYDGETFVDDVVIDPAESSGPLPIVSGRNIVKGSEDEIGLYETLTDEAVGLVTITPKITEDKAAAYYKVDTKDGVNVSGDEPIALGTGFQHLALIESGLDRMVITIYDESKAELYKATFDPTTKKIKKQK